MFLGGILTAEFWKGQLFFIPRTTSAPSHSMTSGLPNTDNKRRPHTSPKHSQECYCWAGTRGSPAHTESTSDAREGTSSLGSSPCSCDPCNNGSQCGVPRLAAAVSLGHLLETHILGPHTRSTESETPGQAQLHMVSQALEESDAPWFEMLGGCWRDGLWVLKPRKFSSTLIGQSPLFPTATCGFGPGLRK